MIIPRNEIKYTAGHYLAPDGLRCPHCDRQIDIHLPDDPTFNFICAYCKKEYLVKQSVLVKLEIAKVSDWS